MRGHLIRHESSRSVGRGHGVRRKDSGSGELNLRTYGWADEYVFARTQETLVVMRKAARKRAADVVRPKPYSQTILLEPDPDDNSLAEANVHRGWPPYMPNERAEPCDYIVIPNDKPHPELRALADNLTERRARKRAGVRPDEPFEGRIINHPLHHPTCRTRVSCPGGDSREGEGAP